MDWPECVKACVLCIAVAAVVIAFCRYVIGSKE